MQKIVLTFGIIAGLLNAGLMIATRPLWTDSAGKMDMGTGEMLGYASMIVALSLIFFGIKSYRDNHLGGAISFGKAFKTGFFISLVAALIYVVGWMAFYHTSESAQQFPQQYKEYQIEQLKASGKAQTEIDQEMAEFDKMTELYKNPVIMAGITLMEILPVGLLISLLSAFLLKTKNT